MCSPAKEILHETIFQLNPAVKIQTICILCNKKLNHFYKIMNILIIYMLFIILLSFQKIYVNGKSTFSQPQPHGIEPYDLSQCV